MSGSPDPKPVRVDDDADAAERLEFRVAVLALDGGCVVHDDCSGTVAAHHCVTQQQLRRAGRSDLLWDPANGFTLCEAAHRRHHARTAPVALSRVPARCVEFARRHGFDSVLERYYDPAR